MDAEWFSLKLVVRFLFAISLVAMMVSTVHAQPPTLLWSDPTVETVDIALSKDGQYLAVASSSGGVGQVRFYKRTSPTPLWTYQAGVRFSSVAISAHGEDVAAAVDTFPQGRVFYWKTARALTGTPGPDWASKNLAGAIEARCLDMSDDGNYVVACGTGPNVFYWADARQKSGVDVATTWNWEGPSIEAVDLSSDGDYVVVGTVVSTVAYWKNARSLSGFHVDPDWESTSPDHRVIDVAISDDGDYVAAATGPLVDLSVHYWAGAKSLAGDPPHTWYYGADVPFTSVDMSCDGNSVIAGSGGRFVEGGSHSVYFWGGARSLTGSPSPTWVYHTDYPVWDVAINDAGTYMAAVDFPIDTVYFFNRQGNLLWQDQAISGDKLSISCDGGTLAVGTPTVTTAYLFDTGYSTPCCGQAPPVGGVVLTSSNALGIITPYLALAVVAGAAALIVAFAKKRKA